MICYRIYFLRIELFEEIVLILVNKDKLGKLKNKIQLVHITVGTLVPRPIRSCMYNSPAIRLVGDL